MANIWLSLLSVVVRLANRRVGLWLLVCWCVVVAFLHILVALLLRLRLGIVTLRGLSLRVVGMVEAGGNFCGANGGGSIKCECKRLHDNIFIFGTLNCRSCLACFYNDFLTELLEVPLKSDSNFR